MTERRRPKLLLGAVIGVLWAAALLAAYSWRRYAVVFWLVAGLGGFMIYESFKRTWARRAEMEQGRRPRYLLSAVVGVMLTLLFLAVYFWPDATGIAALWAMAALIVLYALLRSPQGRREVLWTLLLVGAFFGCVLGPFVMSGYGGVLLMIGLGQLGAVLYFWPRRTFRQPIITREMLEPPHVRERI